MNLTAKLGSSKLTPLLFVLLAAALLFKQQRQDASAWFLIAPLLLLALNLLAAILTQPRLRPGGLMVFHLALLVILILIAIGRLTHFDGKIEVTENTPFDFANVEVTASGPWHRNRLPEVSFVQGPFTVTYASGLKRGRTIDLIHLPGADSTAEHVLIGDDAPLVLFGYRFYTTHNKGFAPVITWTPQRGNPITGIVHMPSYPLFDWKQDNRWRTPGGKEIRFWLHLDVPRNDEVAWILDSTRVSAVLVANVEGERVTVPRGESVRVGDGELRFEALRTWMGYRIFFDPTLPWLLATALVGVLGLAWHAWSRLVTEQKTGLATAEVARSARGVRT